MQVSDLQLLIASRLEDMANQVDILCGQGNYAEADLLREEGLMIAEAYDKGENFFFLGSTFAN